MSRMAVVKNTCYVVVGGEIQWSTGNAWTPVHPPVPGKADAIAADESLLYAWCGAYVWKLSLSADGKPEGSWNRFTFPIP